VIALHNVNLKKMAFDMQFFMAPSAFYVIVLLEHVGLLLFSGNYTCNDVQFNKVPFSHRCYNVDPLSFVKSQPF